MQLLFKYLAAATLAFTLLPDPVLAHGRSGVIINGPGFGFSYGVPTIRRFGHHYVPRLYGYPYVHPGRGAYFGKHHFGTRKHHHRRHQLGSRHDRGRGGYRSRDFRGRR